MQDINSYNGLKTTLVKIFPHLPGTNDFMRLYMNACDIGYYVCLQRNVSLGPGNLHWTDNLACYFDYWLF